MTQVSNIDIPLPPELPEGYVDQYRDLVRDLVANGGDPERIALEYSAMVRSFREAGVDPFDPEAFEPVFEGTAEEAIRWLDAAVATTLQDAHCALAPDEASANAGTQPETKHAAVTNGPSPGLPGARTHDPEAIAEMERLFDEQPECQDYLRALDERAKRRGCTAREQTRR